jgi:copper homeostasis protein
MILEVCVESVAGALAAASGGADRVELCADLYRGGTTPGPGSIRLACEQSSAEVVVLVRPRAGDFCYDAIELEEICADIRFAVEAGASGVAVGALTTEGRVDRDALERFVEAAGSAALTFHRAFDWTVDPLVELEVLIEAGVERVLTSGAAQSAERGVQLLRLLVERADDRIAIVVAGGVRSHNAAEIVSATGVRELHFTAFEPAPPSVYAPTERCTLSASALPTDEERRVTSAEKVRAVRAEAEAS